MGAGFPRTVGQQLQIPLEECPPFCLTHIGNSLNISRLDGWADGQASLRRDVTVAGVGRGADGQVSTLRDSGWRGEQASHLRDSSWRERIDRQASSLTVGGGGGWTSKSPP